MAAPSEKSGTDVRGLRRREKLEKMRAIGCHLSLSGGYARMGETAAGIGANTFAFFTRNPRGRGFRKPDAADLEKLGNFLAQNHFAPLVAHAPYTLNLCSDRPEVRAYAEQTMREDLELLEAIPGNYYNIHPGCHMRKGAETGIREIAEGLNRILPVTSGTVLLLETMAGKGSEVGARFEELRQILDGIQMPERVGICLDTCHVFDAGYDIVNDLEAVLDEFDRTIGFEMLRVIHLNDSKNPCGSHKDRHEKIGEGEIGLDALTAIFAHPRLQGLPFILETPNELPGYEREIALLKKTAEKRCGNDTD